MVSMKVYARFFIGGLICAPLAVTAALGQTTTAPGRGCFAGRQTDRSKPPARDGSSGEPLHACSDAAGFSSGRRSDGKPDAGRHRRARFRRRRRPPRRPRAPSQRLRRRSRRRPLLHRLRSKPPFRPTPSQRSSRTRFSPRRRRLNAMGRSPTRAAGRPTSSPSHPGVKGAEVAKLRRRLAIEGDLDAKHSAGQAWDTELTAAVKRFQARMGLKQTGIVAGATLKAMNVPASVRFRELASSANRLAGANFPFGDRYVVVNLPSTSVEAIENGRVVHRYVAIVGDPEHPSPEIVAQIQVGEPQSDLDRAGLDHQEGNHPAHAARSGLSDPAEDPDPRRLGAGDQSEGDQLDHRAGRQLHAAAGFGGRQLARLDPHRHAQQARRLHARHAVEAPVRRRLSLPEPRLRSGSGRLRLRRVAVAGHARRAERRLGQGGDAGKGEGRRAVRHQAPEAGPGHLGLSHRLVERRRCRRTSATTSTASTRWATCRRTRSRRRTR